MRILWALALNVTLLVSCPFSSGFKTFKRGACPGQEMSGVSPKTNLKRADGAYPIALYQLRVRLGERCQMFSDQLDEVNGSDKAKSSLKEALELLDQPEGRGDYLKHLSLMRSALGELKRAPNETLERIAGQICYNHFLIDLNSTCVGRDYFYELFDKEQKISEHKLLDHKKVVESLFPKTAPLFLMREFYRKFHRYFYASWDSARFSIRSQIAKVSLGGREIRLLRMSCPMVGRVGAQKVDPIFTAYLNQVKESGQKHLYINNQNILSKKMEREASEKLIELSKRYPNNFFVLTLPYDSAFYFQPNLGNERADEFIARFEENVTLQKEGFSVPKALLDSQSFRRSLTQLLTRVHQDFFDRKEYLVGQERRQFIDLVYAYLAQISIELTEADLVNWTCQHGIDRAMSALALFDATLQFASDIPFDFSKTLYLSSWPALLYYHRAPVVKRSQRMLQAIEKLQERQGFVESKFEGLSL